MRGENPTTMAAKLAAAARRVPVNAVRVLVHPRYYARVLGCSGTNAVRNAPQTLRQIVRRKSH